MDSLHAPPPSLPKNKKSLLHLHNILTIPTASAPFWLQLSYILALSFIGFLLLQSLPMKHPSTPKPSHLDFFFTSISANTVSSMAVVEMESFSNSQLLLLTILMLLGGEVFTSMLPLLLLLNHNHKPKSTQLELIVVESSNSTITKHPTTPINSHLGSGFGSGSNKLKKYLGYVVLGYFVALHASGWAFIMGYQSLFPATLAVVESRGIKPNIFAIFTVVSSFTNCGFIPTNENMIVFRSCSSILLAICVLVLLGNTLYPVALRCVVWVLKVVTKRREFDLILKNEEEEDVLDEYVMRNGAEAAMLGATVGGFVVVQVVLFAVTEWGSEGLKGMTVYEKMVGSVFMSVNSRHAGEAIVDLSLLSPAILVLFVVMM